MFTALVALAVLAPSALATVSFTSPVAATAWQAGQQVSITWQEDNTAPLLAAFGPASVGVFVGGTTKELEVFHIADNVNVATTSQINWTVDGSFAPNTNAVFLRFTSNSCTDNSSMHYPCEAFSAKFALNNMNGNFNSTVQQIADDGSATSPSSPAGSSGSAAAVTPTGASVGSNSQASATHASSGAANSSASAKPTGAAAAASGAGGLFTSAGLVAVVASLAGSMML